MATTPIPFRCFCKRKPLLAVCGRDEHGEPFVHLKAEKSVGGGQRRIFAEMVATSGVVRLRCRDCFRWHKIVIIRTSVDFVPEDLPEAISL